MAEDFVELGAEAIDHLTDKHFESGYDRYRKWVNGRKTESILTPYNKKGDDGGAPSDTGRTTRSSRKSGGDVRSSGGSSSEAPREVRSSAGGGPGTTAGNTQYRSTAPATAEDAGGTTTTRPASQMSRRRHRNQLPSPDGDFGSATILSPSAAAAAAATGAAAGYTSSHLSRRERQQSLDSDRVLREYESERDDPCRRVDKVLPPSVLNKIPKSTTSANTKNRSIAGEDRRDSAMTSNYGDGYSQTTRTRSQPARSRYEDDDDSDYDERSGRRSRATGRGYDDDDRYDRVIEETERYRGPVGAGPLVPFARRDDYRAGTNYDDDKTYAVTQYGDRASRRSGDYERSDRDTYLTRRSSRRDRDYDSRSRSRSRSKEGWKEKIEEHFDTSAQGLGVGLAGAVIGGLAGREFGGKKTAQRDMAIGAIIGGIGANLAENKWREWKDKKEQGLERTEERWDQKWDGNGGIGRSRSNVR